MFKELPVTNVVLLLTSCSIFFDVLPDHKSLKSSQVADLACYIAVIFTFHIYFERISNKTIEHLT